MSTKLFPMEGQPKETQYSGWHMDTTKKGLWGRKDDEVPLENRDVCENIEMIGDWRDQQAESSVL